MHEPGQAGVLLLTAVLTAAVSSSEDLDAMSISPSEESSPTAILADWSASEFAMSYPHSNVFKQGQALSNSSLTHLWPSISFLSL